MEAEVVNRLPRRQKRAIRRVLRRLGLYGPLSPERYVALHHALTMPWSMDGRGNETRRSIVAHLVEYGKFPPPGRSPREVWIASGLPVEEWDENERMWNALLDN